MSNNISWHEKENSFNYINNKNSNKKKKNFNFLKIFKLVRHKILKTVSKFFYCFMRIYICDPKIEIY